jgi:hypothetical protein
MPGYTSSWNLIAWVLTMSPKDKRARQLRRAPSNIKPTSASMYLLLALGFGRRIREMRGAAGSVPVIGS